jgi:hypothetical protein
MRGVIFQTAAQTAPHSLRSGEWPHNNRLEHMSLLHLRKKEPGKREFRKAMVSARLFKRDQCGRHRERSQNQQGCDLSLFQRKKLTALFGPGELRNPVPGGPSKWYEADLLRVMWPAFLSELDPNGIMEWDECSWMQGSFPKKKGCGSRENQAGTGIKVPGIR